MFLKLLLGYSDSVACRIILLMITITGRLLWIHVLGLHQCSDTWQYSVRNCAVGIIGPEVAQENIAHSITPPSLACIHQTVHPGAIASDGNQRIKPRPSMWCTRNLDSSDQATFFHFAQFMHCWPFRAVSMRPRLGHGLFRPTRRRLQWTVCCDTLPWSPLL